MPRQPAKKGKTPTPTPTSDGRLFAEPTPSPDEVAFQNTTTDSKEYAFLLKQCQPVPAPRVNPPILRLEQVLPQASVDAWRRAGRMVFHAVGDTGSTVGPAQQARVADQMVAEYRLAKPEERPGFFYHLGDVVYSFGQEQYYYDQFYEPYRNYPAPIFAIPGNHDGVLFKGEKVGSLAAFLASFCSPKPAHDPGAGTLVRTTMTQPGAYFTLEAPFVSIIGLYSNVLENPGVISSEGNKASPVNDAQKQFLIAELKRLKANRAGGNKTAILVATHHPPYSGDARHGGSANMLKDIDDACRQAGITPDAVLSGHAHVYQRFARQWNGRSVPFVVAGSGGHAVEKMQVNPNGTPLRPPVKGKTGDHTLEKFLAVFGYLRVTVTASALTMDFHEVPQTGAPAPGPADSVTVGY